MFPVGRIVKFDSFNFKNGAKPKAKYFIAIYSDGDDLLLASLPTSVDQVPIGLTVSHGCINVPGGCFNCFVFERGKIVCDDSGFSFDMTTFLYGEQLDEHSIIHLSKTYPIEGIDYTVCGQLNEVEFNSLIDCFINSETVSKRRKNLLKSTKG